jgi:Cu+-exporting ATPase
MAKDPVCGMEVDEATAKFKTTHGHDTFYFCAASCQKTFEGDPHRYLPEGHHH